MLNYKVVYFFNKHHNLLLLSTGLTHLTHA